MTEEPAGHRPLGRRFSGWHELIPHRPEVHDERYWPAYLAMAVAVVIHIRLPALFEIGPPWLLPSLQALLLAVLVGGRYLSPRRQEPAVMRRLRRLTIALVALVTVDNLVALGLLIRELLRGLQTDGRTLVLTALAIWVTNVITFALWFWEFDGGGPIPRRLDPDGSRDFLFPQMQLMQDEIEQRARDDEMDGLGQPVERRPPKYIGWLPDFLDYLYLSFTNSTAFSPTDTMPLTIWVKLLMMVQSGAALLTIGLLAARAVNILR